MKEVKLFFLTNKKNIRILYVSLLHGWGLINFKRQQQKVNSSFLYKSEKHLIINKIFGYYKTYLQFLKLKGMGYKFTLVSKGICLRLGFSHRLLYLISKGLKINYLNKQLILLKSRNLFLLKNLFYRFKNIKKLDAYKKKGLYIKGVLLKTKESSKKGKF